MERAGGGEGQQGRRRRAGGDRACEPDAQAGRLTMRAPGRERVHARGAARKLLVQALYQWHLGRQPPTELVAQFATSPEFARVDPRVFPRGDRRDLRG